MSASLAEILGADRYAIAPDVLLAPEGARQDAVMLVEDGAIKTLADRADFACRFPGTPMTPLPGRAVVPGFIDSHIHLGQGFGKSIIGGGFLLVPIFSALYRLPMYVLVAATIPYVIVLSATGLLTYALTVPQFSGTVVTPEWAWGFFAASGGIAGAWCAAKTQRFVPEHMLKLMLGSITGLAGALYVSAYFVDLPFRL